MNSCSSLVFHFTRLHRVPIAPRNASGELSVSTVYRHVRATDRHTWKHHLHELTIGRARAEIFDFGVVRFERSVDPLEDVITTEIVCSDTGVIDIDSGHLECVRTGKACGRNRAVRMKKKKRPISFFVSST